MNPPSTIEAQLISQALQDDGDHFKSLAASADAVVFVLRGSKILYANRSAILATGIPVDELLHVKFHELVHASQRRMIKDLGQRLQRGHHSQEQAEISLLTADGGECWLELSLLPAIFEAKPAVICFGSDISERKRAEKVQDAVYRIAQAADRSNTLDDIYPAVHHIIKEVMLAENFYIALFDPVQEIIRFPYFVDEMDRPSKPGKPGRGLTEYILKTGQSLLCDIATHQELESRGEVELVGSPSPIWLGVPLKIDDIVIGAMVVQHYSLPNVYGESEKRILEFVSSQVARAIHRKQAEQALRESEERYRRLVELSPDAIAIHSGGIIVYANPAALNVMGAESETDLVGKPVLGFVHPDYHQIVKSRIQKTQVEAKIGEILEEKFLRLDGGEIDVEVVAIPTVFNGNPATQVVIRDITERKQAEKVQDIVYRIAQASDNVDSLDQFYPMIHAIVKEVMEADNFYIALYDEESGLLSFPYYVDQVDAPPSPEKPGNGLTEYVLRTGRSALCDLAACDALEKSGEIGLVGSKSLVWLGVPLRVRDKVLGVMVVQDYHDDQVYGEREKRILEYVSSQVAMAIHRRRSEEALRSSDELHSRQAKEFAVLYETARELALQRDIYDLLDIIIEKVRDLLHPSGSAIFLRNQARDDFELSVATGLDHLTGVRIPAMTGLCGEISRTMQAVVVDNMAGAASGPYAIGDVSMSAIAMVPMIFSGELIGILAVFEPAKIDNERVYAPEDIKLLTFFAGVAASAVHNTRLFSETKRRLLELEVLHQTGLASSQIYSAHAIGQRIVESLEQLLDWQRGSIWIFDASQNRPILLSHAIVGVTGHALLMEARRISSLVDELGEGVVGWVCRNGLPFRTGDVKSVSYYVEASPLTRSELCVPLVVGGRVTGCLNVESYRENAFSEHDERLLATVAGQTAIALETARLFDETRRQAARQTAMNSIISATTRTGSDIDAFLDLALDHTLDALGVTIGALWLTSAPRGVHRVASRGLESSMNVVMAEIMTRGRVDLDASTVVNDWGHAPYPFSEKMLNIGIKSSITVPLLSEMRRIGGLSVASAVLHPWNAEEVALVEAIGREVGASVDRARLFIETRSRLAELETINRVSTACRLSHSLADMLPALVDETMAALKVESGSVWLFDPKLQKIKQSFGRGWNLNLAGQELTPGEGILGKVFRGGDVYFSRDILNDPLLDIPTRNLVPAGWSGLCVPIRAEQTIIGVLMVSAQQPNEFTAEDARLLITLSEIAGNTIHRMSLHEQTERHATELEIRVVERTAELQKALEDARAADRVKSEFIANINHELRTPLTNLVLYHQMLRTQPTVKTEERLGVIGRELARLRNLIEDLLNLSRLDLGQVGFKPEPCDVNRLVRTLINDRQSMAEEKGLRVLLDLADGLPSIRLDEALTLQAVSNLLTNAMNYTPGGGRIMIRTQEKNIDSSPMVGIIVEDNGPGISEEDRSRIFERFFRGQVAHSSGAPGTGLGLAIVRQVMERHNGLVEVADGIKGRGASFSLWFPAG